MTEVMLGTSQRHRETRASRAVTLFLARGDLAALVALVLATAFLTVAAPGFATISNLRGVLTDISVILLVAFGMNLVMLSGEIDLSVGSMLAVCATASGFLAMETGSLGGPLLLALVIGVVLGLFNGLVIAWMRVPSVVVTLGTLFAFRGLALLIAQGRQVVSVPVPVRSLSTSTIFGIPLAFLILLGTFMAVRVVRRNVPVLMDVLGIGANREGARVGGARIDLGLMLVFTLTGLLVGLGSVIYLSVVGGAQTIVGTNLELQVVAACAIGGTSIGGGRGSDFAPVVGAVLLGVLINGILLLGVPAVWTQAAYGASILVAISADRLRTTYLARLA